ncbi:MAG: molybdenum cofactor guanylyltransferase [Saccharospirillum sp.]
MTRFAILVLAGGRSSRMERDKSALQWQGKTLLQWQAERFASLAEVVISGPEGITDRWQDHRGPLAGILAACLARPDVDTWIALPVDMPLLTQATVQRLMNASDRNDAALAFADHPLPMALPMTPEATAQLESALQDPKGPRSLRWLHRQLQGQWLQPVPSITEMMNTNTPEEWAMVQRTNRQIHGDTHEQTQQQ